MTKLETKVEKLARELRQAKKEGRELRDMMMAFRPTPPLQATARALSRRERLRAELLALGLIRETTDLEMEMARRWGERPAKEQEQIRAEVRAIKLNKPVSQIVIENRG